MTDSSNPSKDKADKQKPRKEKSDDVDAANRQREKTLEKENEEMKERERKQKKATRRAPYNLPLFPRITSIVLGVVFIGLSFYALFNEALTIQSAILVFGLILLFSGLARLLDAFYDKDIGGTKRIIRFLIASIITLVAVIVIAFPSIGDDVLYILLGLGLLVQGAGRLFTSIPHPAYPAWMKLTKIGLGAVSIAIGIGVILPSYLPDLNVDLLLLLVLGFFISGLSRLVSGLVGVGSKKREK